MRKARTAVRNAQYFLVDVMALQDVIARTASDQSYQSILRIPLSCFPALWHWCVVLQV